MPTPSLAARLAFLLLLGVIAMSAQADCKLSPPPSKIPDGATASDDEMRLVMLAMSHYETDVDNYVKCLAFEASQGRLSLQDQARLQSAALDSHQAVMSRYNAQMRLYMAR